MFASKKKQILVLLLLKSLMYLILEFKPPLPPSGSTTLTTTEATAIPKFGFQDRPDEAIGPGIPNVSSTVNRYTPNSNKYDVINVSRLPCMITLNVKTKIFGYWKSTSKMQQQNGYHPTEIGSRIDFKYFLKNDLNCYLQGPIQ